MEELKVFDRESFPIKHTGKKGVPTVSLTPDRGEVYFSKAVCVMMDLHDGDLVEVVQRGNDPLAIGFRKTDNPNGFGLHTHHGGMRFVSSKLVARILLGFGKMRMTIVQLGSEPEKGIYWILKGSIDKRL